MNDDAQQPNPYDPPQCDDRPIRALANRLGTLGTFVVGLVAIASGAIACGTSCTAIAWVGLMTGAAIGGYSEVMYTGVFVGFCIGAVVGFVLLVLVTRHVFRRLFERFDR